MCVCVCGGGGDTADAEMKVPFAEESRAVKGSVL